MQGGRGSGDPFFGFGDPFSGFGSRRTLFGGRDPFDDPFFTHPFNGMLQPSPFGSPFMDAYVPTIHDHRQSIPNSSRGISIEEVNSDDEKEEPEAGNRMQQYGNQFSMMQRPQAHSFTFQSSTVTYGGSNGAYYTSSTTRRAGSDGVRFEEHKEADSVSGEAAHRISRGIHDKGHTVSRYLKSDGQVDTMQTLHNINEDEVNGFEEAWKGKGRKYLPGWSGGTSGGGWALPSNGQTSKGRRRR